MKKGERIIVKASKRHGVITSVNKSYSDNDPIYCVNLDNESAIDVVFCYRKDLKREIGFWKRVINKLKSK